MNSFVSNNDPDTPKAALLRHAPRRKKPSAPNASAPLQSPSPSPQPSAPSSTHFTLLAVPDKQSRLIDLLKRPEGASMPDMMGITGWQAHSVRGVISGVLRKKLGLNVICESSTDSGQRFYRIVSSERQA